MEERNLKVWDIVEYDKQLVVVTEIDFTGKAAVTRANGGVTHINKDFLQNHIKGNIAGMIAERLKCVQEKLEVI